MEHISFFWLPFDKQIMLESLKTEFAQQVSQSIKNGHITLPPIPDVVLKIQQLCTEDTTGITEIANCLLDDPGMAATVIRVANSVIFNRRNITCTDLFTAVSRLGILRVRDIVTAQAIEQLKQSVDLSRDCNDVLVRSATVSRELGATMVMVTQEYIKQDTERFGYLEQEKALMVGLLADIGLFCLVNEYHRYLSNGNYLDKELALQLFKMQCSDTSRLVLERWGFDSDFCEVSCNAIFTKHENDVSYLDIARIAHHLLQFRSNDEEIENHDVEFDLIGAEVLYDLSNLSDMDFKQRQKDVIQSSGL